MSSPLLAIIGRIPAESLAGPPVIVDPARAIATCLKPADDPEKGGIMVRLRELAGLSGPLKIVVSGFRRVFQTDLLERDLEELPIKGDLVEVNLHAGGFAGLRLLQ